MPSPPSSSLLLQGHSCCSGTVIIVARDLLNQPATNGGTHFEGGRGYDCDKGHNLDFDIFGMYVDSLAVLLLRSRWAAENIGSQKSVSTNKMSQVTRWSRAAAGTYVHGSCTLKQRPRLQHMLQVNAGEGRQKQRLLGHRC